MHINSPLPIHKTVDNKLKNRVAINQKETSKRTNQF